MNKLKMLFANYKVVENRVLKSESPVYDGRGRVTQVLDQNNNVVSQNSYDDFGRLESVSDANHSNTSNDTLAALMKYAPDGSLLALNRGTFTAGQAVNNDYIYYNGTHRLNKVTGLSMNLLGGRNLNQADNFAYDVVGRMTSDFSKDMNISWRPDDMPHSILIGKTMGDWTDTHVEMNFAYAGTQIAQFRNRILNNTLSTEEAQFDLLGGKQIRVGEDGKIRAIMIPENGGRRTDLWDESGNIITTNKEFYATDYLGSMARSYQFKNGTWSLALAREYDVWGKVIQSQEIANAEDDDKSFTGQNYEDETGLISFPARRYDADVPRWVSPDMARQHFDLYLYGSNNPINNVDPDGNADVNIEGEIDGELTSVRLQDPGAIGFENSIKTFDNGTISKIDFFGHGSPRSIELSSVSGNEEDAIVFYDNKIMVNDGTYLSDLLGAKLAKKSEINYFGCIQVFLLGKI